MKQNDQEQTLDLDNIVEDRTYYTSFFGESSEYYNERYERFIAGETVRFNFYAFFLGLFWMGYRKMYLELIVVILMIVFVEVILDLVFEIDSSSVNGILNLGWAGVFGCCANYFYFKKAERTVAGAKDKYDSVGDQLDYLKKEGGTSYVAPIILVILFGALFIGAWVLQEYVNNLDY